MRFRTTIAIVIISVLILPQTIPAQVRSQTGTGSLRLYVLRGQNAVNSIPAHRIIAPVVEVRNVNDQPVEGAEVRFELPASGPGGLFEGGQRVFTARSNLQGQARAAFTPNQEPGTFHVLVTATIAGQSGQATITQTNSTRELEALEAQPKTRRGLLKSWKFWAIVGAAGAAAAVVAITRGGDSSTGSSTITITPGGPSVGGPR